VVHNTSRSQFSSYFVLTFQQRSFNFIITTSELLLFALGPFLFSDYDWSRYCPKWQAASSHLLLLHRRTAITHQLVTYLPHSAYDVRSELKTVHTIVPWWSSFYRWTVI